MINRNLKKCVTCENYLECDSNDKNGVCDKWEALRSATKFEKREMFEIPDIIKKENLKIYNPSFDGCFC